jgi:hypothetical protein
MNVESPAERFNRELDELFSGSKAGSHGSDPGAMETAEKLFRADFSGDSGIRSSLRAELLKRSPSAAWPGAITRMFGHNAYLRAAMAGACVLLVLLPVMLTISRRSGFTGTDPAQQAARSGFVPALPVSSAAVSGARKAARLPEPEKAAAQNAAAGVSAPPEAGAGSGIFRGIPMAALAGGRTAKLPIETRKGGYPIKRLKGRALAFPKGSGVVWETEDAVFTLERRTISPEELFCRRAL